MHMHVMTSVPEFVRMEHEERVRVSEQRRRVAEAMAAPRRQPAERTDRRFAFFRFFFSRPSEA